MCLLGAESHILKSEMSEWQGWQIRCQAGGKLKWGHQQESPCSLDALSSPAHMLDLMSKSKIRLPEQVLATISYHLWDDILHTLALGTGSV